MFPLKNASNIGQLKDYRKCIPNNDVDKPQDSFL